MSSALALPVRPLSRFFKALGDDTRLRIVALLAHGELCVCHIETALRISQPNTSRHLALLRIAGVVEPRREGNWIYYSLAEQLDDRCKRQLRLLVTTFGKQQVLRQDVARLVKTRGPSSCK